MTDEDLTKRFDAIDKRFEGIDQRFDGTVTSLKELIQQEGIATRRHFDIVAESLKSDIKLIASGHESLVASQATLAAERERLAGRQERLELRQLALETRRRTPKSGRSR